MGTVWEYTQQTITDSDSDSNSTISKHTADMLTTAWVGGHLTLFAFVCIKFVIN